MGEWQAINERRKPCGRMLVELYRPSRRRQRSPRCPGASAQALYSPLCSLCRGCGLYLSLPVDQDGDSRNQIHWRASESWMS
jgi:hypothetical protein